jgi:hypothetical protein
LRDAKDDGDLIALPSAEDWPVGLPRNQRAISLSRLATHRQPELEVAVQKLFDLSPVGTRLLLAMLQREHVDKTAVHGMSSNCVDVHICRLRQQLKRHRIKMHGRSSGGRGAPS